MFCHCKTSENCNIVHFINWICSPSIHVKQSKHTQYMCIFLYSVVTPATRHDTRHLWRTKLSVRFNKMKTWVLSIFAWYVCRKSEKKTNTHTKCLPTKKAIKNTNNSKQTKKIVRPNANSYKVSFLRVAFGISLLLFFSFWLFFSRWYPWTQPKSWPCFFHFGNRSNGYLKNRRKHNVKCCNWHSELRTEAYKPIAWGKQNEKLKKKTASQFDFNASNVQCM